MTFFQILWGVLAIVAILVEAFTTELVSIWFFPASVISLILAICEVSIPIQIAVFVLVTVLSIVLFRSLLIKRIKPPKTTTNADALIGEKAVVIVPINNLEAQGQVKVRGQVWSARSEDPNVLIAVDSVVTVTAIEGVKLICHL
ncbi:MAG: NfeD family protein [Clostridia bacterium]|nr:NfeD family protein [Clostridia bacterium]